MPWCATTPTCTATRTAGAPTRRSSTGPSRPGSSGSPRSRTACSTTTSRSPGCPSTSATVRSASGWRGRATGRSAATASGARRSRCGRATTRSYPQDRRLRQPRRARARLRRAARRPPPARHRRAHPAEPRRPHRAVDDASRRGRARLLVRVGIDAVRPGALPVREPGVVRWPLPRRLHRASTSARPEGGSTRCTCWPPPCSTSRRSAPAWPTAFCWASDGQKLSKRLKNYPDPDEVFDTVGADAMRWALLRVGGDAGRRHRRRPPTSGRARAPGAAADLERLVLPLAVRQRRRAARADVDDVVDTCSTATPSPRPGSWSTRWPPASDAYDLSGACAAVQGFVDSLNNWYIRRSRDRFWRGDARGGRHAAHRARAVVPGRRAPAAAAHRAPLPGADRRAQRPSHRLALLRRAPRRPRGRPDRRRHGPRPRRVLGRRLGAQGTPAAHPPAAADRSPSPPPTPTGWPTTPVSSPTRSTSRPSSSPTTWPRPASSCSRWYRRCSGPGSGQTCRS